ncbi:hypothetical protein BGW37DRAFT_489389 [Umbelopsis sp. PMI_123]|nr:hypothetical protein BGW37DRAFT_489389 [Umbelopsis sp. PMI_123]
MNVVKEIQRINQREADRGYSESGSWHAQYKDSAYVFVGGLSYDLSEGDVICIFSQYGEIMNLDMPRDKQTGKTRGFAFLQYEDQRSTVLAVDNLNGSKILGRVLRVDHAQKPKPKKDEDGNLPDEPSMNAAPPLLDASSSDESEDDGIDEEDPMAEYLRKKEKKRKKKEERSKSKKKSKREDKDKRDWSVHKDNKEDQVEETVHNQESKRSKTVDDDIPERRDRLSRYSPPQDRRRNYSPDRSSRNDRYRRRSPTPDRYRRRSRTRSRSPDRYRSYRRDSPIRSPRRRDDRRS